MPSAQGNGGAHCAWSTPRSRGCSKGFTYCWSDFCLPSSILLIGGGRWAFAYCLGGKHYSEKPTKQQCLTAVFLLATMRQAHKASARAQRAGRNVRRASTDTDRQKAAETRTAAIALSRASNFVRDVYRQAKRKGMWALAFISTFPGHSQFPLCRNDWRLLTMALHSRLALNHKSACALRQVKESAPWSLRS